MGLLTRRRKPAGPVVTADGPVPVTNAAPPAAPDPAAPVTERTVIRAADLDDAPGWTTLPPPAPLLAPMPYVFSHHFEDDLVAWQAPELALAPLGHAISTTAPAGVVEAIAVLSPEPLGETAAGAGTPDPALPLVMPVDEPPAAGPPDLAPYRSARSTSPPSSPPPGTTDTRPSSSAPAQPLPPRPTSAPRPSPPAGPAAGRTSAAPGPTMDLPPAPASSTPAPAPAPAPAPLPAAPVPPTPEGHETGLVGDVPLAAGLAPVTPTEAPNPLLQAPSPPQLPLVQLPATRLTAAEAARSGSRFDPRPPAVPGAPTSASPPVARTPGVPAAETPSDASGPAVAMPPDAPSPPAASLVGERGLGPPIDPIDRAVGDEVPADKAEGEVALPLVDRPGPQESRVGAEPSAPGLPAAAVAPGAPAESVTPKPPEAQEPPTPTAPLVGDAPLLAPGPTGGSEPGETAEPTSDSLPVARRSDGDTPPSSPSSPPRRTGLGQPMQGLPPTAARFDPLALAQRMSMGDMIRTRTERKASPGRPSSASRDPGRRGPGQTAPGSPQQGSGLPLAPGSALPRLGSGVGAEVAGTVSDSGYPAPRVLPLVPIERLGPMIAGTAPDAVAPAGAVGPLASLRPSLLDPIPPSRPAPLPSPPPPAEGAAVRAAVGQRHGVDLSQVPVDRSAAGAARARSLGARGFTSHSEVVIPPDAGTLNAGPGQALLAHELTHVAQRARRGPNLPAEHTPEGQVLEAEARSAELALAPSAPVRAAAAETASRQAAASPPVTDQAASALPLAATSRPGDTVTEATLMAAMQKLSEMGTPTPPSGGPTTVVMTPASVATPAPAAAVQRASVAELAGRFSGQAPQAPSESGSASSVFSTRPSDADLSKLVRWLYPLISFRIRGELRENRERAGLLTDSYRRW